MKPRQVAKFQKTIYSYYRTHKRRMPWRETTDPYRILVSEIMLQQTQVSRVIPKYNEFIKAFPHFKALHKAPLASVLKKWSGLGYNRRAKLLKDCAKIVVEKYRGVLPEDLDSLDSLPGIGKATAGAICAYAFNQSVSFIETNVRTAYIHFFFKGQTKVSDTAIGKLVEQTLDHTRPREWYYALMDYGAMLKSTGVNPNHKSVHYVRQSAFKGSRREVRGAIIKNLTKVDALSIASLKNKVGGSPELFNAALQALISEGMVEKNKNVARLMS